MNDIIFRCIALSYMIHNKLIVRALFGGGSVS